ncbi:hypothetical protein J2I47_20400 [Fibrella sp. HMF5335]|uniref:Uncharacterized protein n=1 Tax=Fibrella rubiginis TaxID=2817060 RepID=A0A939GLC0_9BACT|nr:hypothetical protein [Fibrella rubiginis]MBO0938925.1 hypothetical protein [Fibrella rubiginis]
MSVSSNIRKESTESNAAQMMHSTMGTHPDLAQLNDKDLTNELPSKLNSEGVADSVADDVESADEMVAETDANGPSQAEIDENTRASWGQAPVEGTHVQDADWNTSTEEK